MFNQIKRAKKILKLSNSFVGKTEILRKKNLLIQDIFSERMLHFLPFPIHVSP